VQRLHRRLPSSAVQFSRASRHTEVIFSGREYWWQHGGVNLTHLGHACVLVETAGARLLIDPGTLSSVDGITGLDAVLVTHQHADHADPVALAALLAANRSARLVVHPGSVTAVAGLPADHLVARPGDRLTFGGCTVHIVGGLHAAVYGPVPGCTNNAYLLDDGAFLHPATRSITCTPWHPASPSRSTRVRPRTRTTTGACWQPSARTASSSRCPPVGPESI